MHSPIMCISSGIPRSFAIHEQTHKGFMWRDIGLNEWLFTSTAPTKSPARANGAAIAKDPATARAKR